MTVGLVLVKQQLKFCIPSMFSSQGNTKQQTTLSTAFLSFIQIYILTYEEGGVFLLNVFLWITWKIHLWQGFLRCQFQHNIAELTLWASFCPSTVSLATWMNSHCLDMTQQFYIQVEPFLSFLPCSLAFNHMLSFRSIIRFRYCGINFVHNKQKHPTWNAHKDYWVQL